MKKRVFESRACVKDLCIHCIQNRGKSVLGMKYSGNAGLFCAELEAGYRTMLPYVITIFLVGFYSSFSNTRPCRLHSL